MPNARMLQCLAFSLPQTFIAPNYESKLGGPLQTQMHFTDTSSVCGDPDFLSRVKTVYGASVSSGMFRIFWIRSWTLVKRGGLSNPFCSLSWISTTVQTPGPYILDYNNPVCGSKVGKPKAFTQQKKSIHHHHHPPNPKNSQDGRDSTAKHGMNDSRRRHTISQQGLQNLIAASKTRSTGSSKYVPDSRVYATPQAPLQIGQSPSTSSRLLSATQGLNGPTANRLSCDECNKHLLPALLTIVGSFRYCDACKPAANSENCSQPASETYDQARLCRGCFIRASRSGVGSNGPQTTHQNIPNMMDQRFHEQERLRNQALSDSMIVAYKAVKSKSTNGFVYTEVKNLIQEKMEFSDTTTFRELAAFLTSPQCERINKVYATVEHETASTEIYTMKGNNPGAELNASSLIHKHLPHHTPKLPKKKATAPVARVAVVFVSKQRLVDSEEDEEFAIHTSSRRKVSRQRPEVERSRSLPTGSSAVRMVGRVPRYVHASVQQPCRDGDEINFQDIGTVYLTIDANVVGTGSTRVCHRVSIAPGTSGVETPKVIRDVPSWVVKMQRRDIVLQTPEHVGQQSYCQQQLYAHDFITQCLETYDCLKDHFCLIQFRDSKHLLLLMNMLRIVNFDTCPTEVHFTVDAFEIKAAASSSTSRACQLEFSLCNTPKAIWMLCHDFGIWEAAGIGFIAYGALGHCVERKFYWVNAFGFPTKAPNLTDFSDNMSLILGVADVDSDGNISFQGGNYSDVFSGAYGLDNSAVTYQMESDAAFRIWVSSNQASLSADNSCVYKYLAWQRSISFHKFTLVRYSIGEQTLLDGMDIEDGCIKYATSYELGLFNFDNQEGKNCGNPDPKSRFKRYFGDDADLSYGLLDLADGLFQIFVGETKRRDESYPATFHYFDESFSQTLATTTAMDTTVTVATETTIYTASSASSINTVSDISTVSTSDSTVSTISTIESNGPNSTATTTSAVETPKSSISTESSTLDATNTIVSTLSSSASATSDNLQISSTIDFTATTVTDFQSASEIDTDIASTRSQSVSFDSVNGLTATTSFMTSAFSTGSSTDQETKTQSFTQSTSSILSRPVDSSQTDALSLRSTVTQILQHFGQYHFCLFTSTTRTATSSKIPSSVSTTACIINNPSQAIQMIANGPIPSSLPGYLAQLNAVFSASTFQIIDGLPLSSPATFSGAPLSQGPNAVVVLILSENFKFTGNSGVGYDNNKCNSAISVNSFSVQTNVIGFSYVLDETVTSEWFSLQVSNDQSRLTVNVYTEHQAIATFEFSLSARNTRASIDTEFVVVNGVGSVIQPFKIVSTSISNSGLPTTAATQTPSASTVLSHSRHSFT
ncbi:hypothetical protein BCR33DRAFT_850439 [Rhizoclosmatium globosum]|uniref:Uncharacterized protein n=1 Tax=Rhizoclosmatium globosum TaxID=329046 RepID=A0A1Y2CB82_9FUNG|nr:hypothetical protein BCR33DRAFT_850439 [Rhizoclosmatium globosum]|eukprot:ORY44300.1 hypothetical protein BCR33DRAFT_850439 [Rhizoclosmatium globosum]